MAQHTSDLFQKLHRLPGMLTLEEEKYLYRLAQTAPGKGAIVEIGSWKGKSTIYLALGSIAAGGEKVYAVDPHTPLPVEGYTEDTRAEFLQNIRDAQVEPQVVPLLMTSEEAARNWSRPIRLLWIDGDHRYEQAKQDFLLWEPHVVEGGVIAMHDTIRKKGPKRVLWESVFRSDRFQNIAIVDNITAARKVKRITLRGRLAKWLVIGFRGGYIAARKMGVPGAKPAGRWLLKKLTA
jgi:predicted O-methyltransferase YrrM